MQNLRKIMKSRHLDLNEERTSITETENCFDWVETTLKEWFDDFRHSRWKHKEHMGRYKDLKLLGLKLPSPPP